MQLVLPIAIHTYWLSIGLSVIVMENVENAYYSMFKDFSVNLSETGSQFLPFPMEFLIQCDILNQDKVNGQRQPSYIWNM